MPSMIGKELLFCGDTEVSCAVFGYSYCKYPILSGREGVLAIQLLFFYFLVSAKAKIMIGFEYRRINPMAN